MRGLLQRLFAKRPAQPPPPPPPAAGLLQRISRAEIALACRGIRPTRLELTNADYCEYLRTCARPDGSVRPLPYSIDEPLHGFSCLAGKIPHGKYEVVAYDREPLA